MRKRARIEEVDESNKENPTLPLLEEPMLIEDEIVLTKDLDLYVSLQEISEGCSKDIYYHAYRRRSADNTVTKIVEKMTIIVPPGCPTGTKFIFPQKGDRVIGAGPTDVIVTLREKAHPYFTRDGSDIIHTVTLAKHQLDRGTKIKVPTLHGDFIWVAVKCNKTKRIRGLGLSKPNNSSRQNLRGDLVIKINVEKAVRVTRLSAGCFRFMK